MQIKFLAGNVKWKRYLGTLKFRWENIIKMKRNLLDIRI